MSYRKYFWICRPILFGLGSFVDAMLGECGGIVGIIVGGFGGIFHIYVHIIVLEVTLPLRGKYRTYKRYVTASTLSTT